MRSGRLKKRGAWVIHELDGKIYVLELIWTVNTSLQRDNVDWQREPPTRCAPGVVALPRREAMSKIDGRTIS